jgi:hypothetical protein
MGIDVVTWLLDELAIAPATRFLICSSSMKYRGCVIQQAPASKQWRGRRTAGA